MLRITGGIFRGRKIDPFLGPQVRPTLSKLRQALFNSLSLQVEGARVLDLFAGSGVLGLEALSRGAEHVLFVDSQPEVLRSIQRSVRELGVEKQVSFARVTLDLKATSCPQVLLDSAPYEFVISDPPYAQGWEEYLLKQWPWERLLSPQGKWILEWRKQRGMTLAESEGFLVKMREKNYGDSNLTTYLLDKPV